MNPAVRPLRRTWLRSSVIVGAHPRAYLPFARWRYGRDLAFGPDTEIVIEGFPRSANSFAVVAFRQAQERPVRIAHHLHQPAQVIAAAHHRIPSIVLLRPPDEAIVSYLIWQPHLTAADAVQAYVGFHRPLVGLEDGFVVAPFAEVTSDYGPIVSSVNDRFGTAFTPFDHTEANVSRAFEEIERTSRERRGGRLVETAVARPSDERRKLAERRLAELDGQIARSQRAEADALYEHFLGLSAGPGSA